MSELAIGVIGVGGMGARHAHNLSERVAHARVATVYDFDSARAESVARACAATVARDPRDMIADPSIAAVLIATPDHTHAALAMACVEHRKPVLCEKPLAVNSDDALAIVRAEAAYGQRLVSLGFMRRFDPQHVGIKQAINAGQIGRPVLFKGSSRDFDLPDNHPIDTLMTNSVIHDLDSLRWLMSSDIEEIYMRGTRSRPGFAVNAYDVLLITASLAGGTLGLIEIAASAGYGYDIGAEVVGDRGAAETAHPDGALVRHAHQRSLAVPTDWLDRFQAAYVAEAQAWIESLYSETIFPGACAWDGYLATLNAEACLRSIRSGAAERITPAPRPALYA